MHDPDVHFKRMTAATVLDVCKLSYALSDEQRNMVAGPFQGKGYGARAIHRLLAHLRSMGVRELYTCCETGPAGPEGFYRRLGFEPTGDCYGDQPEYVLRLDE